MSTRANCIANYGEPDRIRANRKGAEEYVYSNFTARFDPNTGLLRECTLLPKTAGLVDDIEITWDTDFLRRACERDENPRDVYGFIVLTRLGIAVTGIHDGDDSQLAITAFCEGAFDDLLRFSRAFSAATFGLP